jgi:hypothetical protein
MTSNKTIWVVRAGIGGEADDIFLKQNMLAIGWPAIGDLNKLPESREAINSALKHAYLGQKPGWYPIATGQLYRFRYEMQNGDLIVYPSKNDRLIHIGTVTGDYRFAQDIHSHYSNIRPVKWINAVQRSQFSDGASNELNSALTLFKIAKHADEIFHAIDEQPSFTRKRIVTATTDSVNHNSFEQIILLCRHCGNKTPHSKQFMHSYNKLFESINNEEIFEKYNLFAVACGTCNGLTLLGGFVLESSDDRPGKFPILYPAGPNLLPPIHTLASKQPVPDRVMQTYLQAWPLRHTAPSAFANQIRRAIEFICIDKSALGNNLYEKLKDLAIRAVFPSNLADTAELIRQMGNRGSHAESAEIDIWDAELLDDLFRTIVQYVYISPSQAERMRSRLGLN